MNEREYRVLLNLLGSGWCIPLDVGGSSGSHHSATLTKLVKRGYVERLQRGGMPDKGRNARGSWKYRITPEGEEALKRKDQKP